MLDRTDPRVANKSKIKVLSDLLLNKNMLCLVYYTAEKKDGIIQYPREIYYKNIHAILSEIGANKLSLNTIYLLEYKRQLQYLHREIMRLSLRELKGFTTFGDIQTKKAITTTLSVQNLRTIAVLRDYFRLLTEVQLP